MPYPNRISMANKIKRLMVVIFAVAISISALGRMGLQLNSFAAIDQNQAKIVQVKDRAATQPLPTDENIPQAVSATRTSLSDDCSYLREPEKFNDAIARHRDEISRTTERFSLEAANATDKKLIPPQNVPRKNYIDTILFDRMAKDSVMSAAICTDEEFIRRVYLDLTGRIPAATTVTTFLKDTNASKRDVLIDSLIGTPEYIDKWTMFFGDLYKNTARSVNITRYSGGRDGFYNYIKDSITTNKNYAQMVTEMITANGDNFVNGENNFIVGGNIPMGPAQDTMDGRAVQTASMFLGINSLDCLLCHNGAGHLTNVNLWGAQRTRAEAWGMSAFFARVNIARTVLSQTPNYYKFTVSERTSGEYLLNTNSGNRQNRNPINGVSTVAPNYILGGGGVNTGENRRQALARLVTTDKQFARATVNYIWEKLMVEALVSPSNTFDPARLDPNAQLPSGWAVQPANPELLEALTTDFIKSNYNLRTLIATIVKANAYQLSSQYPGTWSLALVPYFARKYVRRLDAEEIHDAILSATAIGAAYQLKDTLGNNTWSVSYAMQLPDPSEPRINGTVAQFLNSFIRGDRDVKPRSQEPSILQSLNLMNHSFVMLRIHQANAGSNVAKLLGNATLTNQDIITQLYLSTLSRNPGTEEMNTLVPLYSTLSKTGATEAIQWILLNKMDFIFNY